MAIIKKIELPSGIICEAAYLRISDLRLSYSQKRAWIKLLAYKDKEARLANKEPLFETDEYRVYNTGGSPSVEARFIINFNDIVKGSGQNLIIKLNREGLDPIIICEITEGINLILTGEETPQEKMQIIWDIIRNTNENIGDFDIVLGEYDYDIVLIILPASEYSGSVGNNIEITGTMVGSVIKFEDGVDKVLPTFEKYFSPQNMQESGVDVVARSYQYIKTLDEYKDCIDDN